MIATVKPTNLAEGVKYMDKASNASHYSLAERVSSREILDSVRHIAPHVVFQNAPISYMFLGQAGKFYQGEGENTNALNDDPSVLMYYIVKAHEYQEVIHGDNDYQSKAINEG